MIGRTNIPVVRTECHRHGSRARFTERRAARALLRWSAEDLARESALGIATIRRAKLMDSETSMTVANNLAVLGALENVGGRVHRGKRRRSGRTGRRGVEKPLRG